MAGSLRALLVLLVGLTVAGYLGVNIVVLLPRGAPLFLVAENLVYSLAYTVLGYYAARGSVGGLACLAAIVFFNAGRVSRTIIAPDGSIGVLAVQHTPLLALLLGLGAASLYCLARRGRC